MLEVYDPEITTSSNHKALNKNSFYMLLSFLKVTLSTFDNNKIKVSVQKVNKQ